MTIKTSCPCFSCGSEAAWWTERNCDRCVKSSRLKANSESEYTKSRCKIFDEIFEQWMGYGNEPVSLRTFNATLKADCPFRQEHYKPRKRISNDKSLTLDF
jgi:hypothetical protein